MSSQTVDKKEMIQALVKSSVESYAAGFQSRHESEIDDEEGTLNMKIHNVFIAALGSDIQYYSALVRSLDSSLGSMLEKLAINIANFSYEVKREVQGPQSLSVKLVDKKLLNNKSFWNFICKSCHGYDMVFSSYKKALEGISYKKSIQDISLWFSFRQYFGKYSV